MSFKSKRFLGAIDAAKDKNLEKYFIEIHDIKRIIDDDSDIIYGAKGVGKTALNRALTEINSGIYLNTKTIDLNSISFNQIYKKLAELHHKTETEIIRLSSNIWRNILIIHGLEALYLVIPDSESAKSKIRDILNAEGFNIESSNGRFLAQIQRIIDYIISVTTSSEANNQLTPYELENINNFPFNKNVTQVIKESLSYKRQKNKKILISLDGFDSIINHNPESRKAIFAGLIDAIYQHSVDSEINELFCFKAFLPEELTDNLESIIWDADKSFNNTHFLKWNRTDLQQFLLPRLREYSKSKSNDFNDIWLEYMPDKIKNPVHGNYENTFEYILRHTLFRPRQLLMHVQKILDLWDETYVSFRVDPSFIPNVVSQTNYSLSNFLTGQLEYSLPGLTELLQSNYGCCNVISVYELKKMISNKFTVTDHKDVISIFNDLFNLGIYGFAKQKDLPKHGKQFKFDFAYSDTDPVGYTQIHNKVTENDFMGLSPMLHEYCGCTINQHGAIYPRNI